MKKRIEEKVVEIIDNEFEIEDVDTVPDLEDQRLTFGNKGLRFEATVLYIDIRGSTEILNKHKRKSVAKLHSAYFHTIVTIAKSLGGEVRSFNGDGMLVFFQGTTKDSLSNAVKAAMKMVYMLTSKDSSVREKMEKYSPLDFGIGLDDGKILCTKVGISGTNNRDLVWIGNAVNKAAKLGDAMKSPYHIGISELVYENLNDDVKYHKTTGTSLLLGESKKNMWKHEYFCSGIEYNGKELNYYHTNYYWEVA